MKVRSGFVSNSSSSSFVVAFPKGIDPNDVDAIHQYLYGKAGQTLITTSYGEGGLSTTRAAELIAEDMQRTPPNNPDNISDAFSGWLPGAPEFNDFFDYRTKMSDDERRKCFEAYGKAQDEFQLNLQNQITEEWKDFDLYTFEFSDNDGDLWATLEHGNTFKNVPHKCISKH